MDLAETKNLFAGRGDDMSRMAADSLSCLLNKEVSPCANWKVGERLHSPCDYTVTMECSNSACDGIVLVGGNWAGCRVYAKHSEDILDVFGEAANNFCGLLMDSAYITDSVGVLVQSLPVYHSGEVFFPRAASMAGSICTEDDVEVYMGFCVRTYVALLNI
jgi:hypothetical protein